MRRFSSGARSCSNRVGIAGCIGRLGFRLLFNGMSLWNSKSRPASASAKQQRRQRQLFLLLGRGSDIEVRFGFGKTASLHPVSGQQDVYSRSSKLARAIAIHHKFQSVLSRPSASGKTNRNITPLDRPRSCRLLARKAGSLTSGEGVCLIPHIERCGIGFASCIAGAAEDVGERYAREGTRARHRR
jgi:hypothetical protein